MREGLGRYKVRKILTKIERVKKKKKKLGGGLTNYMNVMTVMFLLVSTWGAV